MTQDSYRVAEIQFRDARILAAYILVPLACAFMLARRTASKLPATQRDGVKFLFCFAAVTYVAWLNMFGVYRYLIPLEMLAPLLIVLAVMSLPVARVWQAVILIGVLVAVQSALDVDPVRQSWRGKYVEVQLPPIAQRADNMVLMAGYAPMAFVIPSFPAEVRFLRIDGWTVQRQDATSGLARQMRQAVAQHQGNLLMLFSPAEQAEAVRAAHDYGLELVKPACAAITSNIAAPLRLCSLARQPSADGAVPGKYKPIHDVEVET
jgi:hypothetical protein